MYINGCCVVVKKYTSGVVLCNRRCPLNAHSKRIKYLIYIYDMVVYVSRNTQHTTITIQMHTCIRMYLSMYIQQTRTVLMYL